MAHWVSTKWQCSYSYEVFVPRTCKPSLSNRIRKMELIQRANMASPPHVRRLRMNRQRNECIWGRSWSIIPTSQPTGPSRNWVTSVFRFAFFGPSSPGLSFHNMMDAVTQQGPGITPTRCYFWSQQKQSLSHVAPFKHTTFPEALRLQKTFLYSSIPSSTPIINKEKAQNTTVFVTSRLSGTEEGKYWNGSRVNICQHEGVVQPKGQDSTFVKSKPNPRNSNFNLWTSELILVHWFRMSRLFGNLFALG